MKKLLPLVILILTTVFAFNSLAKNRTEEVIKQIQKKDAMVVKTVAMEYKKFDDKYFIRINPGHPLVNTLNDFCKKQNITLATISGIGSLNSATLGFFNPNSKTSKQKTFNEPLNMTSLLGNITIKDNEPVLNLNTTIAGDNYKAYSGQLLEAEVSLTSEIVITTIKGKIEKTFDPQTGLNLYDFKK